MCLTQLPTLTEIFHRYLLGSWHIATGYTCHCGVAFRQAARYSLFSPWFTFIRKLAEAEAMPP